MSLEGVGQIDESDHLLLAPDMLLLLWNLVPHYYTMFPASILASRGITAIPKRNDLLACPFIVFIEK